MKKLWAIAALAALGNAAPMQGAEALLNPGLAISGGYVSGTAGWTFQPTTLISVTSLGTFTNIVKQLGPIDVGLWDAGGSLLASVLVDQTDSLLRHNYYESISSLTLLPSQIYTIGAFPRTNSIITMGVIGDVFGGGAVHPPEIQLRGPAVPDEGEYGIFTFPADQQGADDIVLLTANFQYTVVPEPSTLALAGLSGLVFLLRRRNG